MQKGSSDAGWLVFFVFLCGVAAITTGCVGTMAGGDGVTWSGSTDAVRAWFDGQAAVIAQAKSNDPKGDTAYWRVREKYEEETTERVREIERNSTGGILGRLFGGNREENLK